MSFTVNKYIIYTLLITFSLEAMVFSFKSYLNYVCYIHKSFMIKMYYNMFKYYVLLGSYGLLQE